jgi:small-conductance mechanosensitive channel
MPPRSRSAHPAAVARARVFRIGGIVSGAVLIVFGVVTIVLAVYGHHTVKTQLERQKITGTPDMSPSKIQEETNRAGLEDVDIPSCTVAGKPIDTGPRAECFSEYMNIHALLATGGFVYSQMGQYTAKPYAPKSELAPGGGTNNPQYAVVDPKTNQPVSNGARNVWVSETGLSTALNVAFMASALSLFSLIVGIALVLAGVGFIVLALAALPGRARSVDERT